MYEASSLFIVLISGFSYAYYSSVATDTSSVKGTAGCFVVDHVKGSWYHQLNEKNEVIGTVWPGKSDLYHAFQATKIPYMPVDTSVAVNVQRNAHEEL